MSLRDRASRATNGVYVGPKAIVHTVYGIDRVLLGIITSHFSKIEPPNDL